MSLIELCERGRVPDWAVRFGIRRLLGQRLRQERTGGEAAQKRYLEELSHGPVAESTEAANEQHYEVPAEFFCQVLGSYRKYSCGYWKDSQTSLDDAESAMLELTCRRAQLKPGSDILELGCGWGSLTLWMAQHYPSSTITAVSNSSTQKAFIDQQCQSMGLNNVNVITADMREFSTEETYDHVISIEMFEHMRNYQELMRRVGRWLRPGGSLFVHVFCHRDLLYPFETDGNSDWMARYFFTGGIMPAADTLPRFHQQLVLEAQWRVSGMHYFNTCQAWLSKLDRNRKSVKPIFDLCYGESDADIWIQRWRMFFMACGELFRFRQGNEWQVAHYRFRQPTGETV